MLLKRSRLLLLLLALASAAAVPVRPSLHGLSPVLPAVARTRRRGGAPPLASAVAREKLELLDTAAQLDASVATGQLVEAMRLQALAERPHNEEEYASLIALAGAAGNWQLAVRLLREMDEMGLAPAAPAHLAAMWACARAAQWRAALELLDEVELYGLPNAANGFTAAASACRAAGEWAAAVALLRRARLSGTNCDAFLYMHVVDACEEASQHGEAMKAYAQAVESGVLSHWRDDEPFSIDVHGLSAPTAACAVRHALRHEVGNFMSSDLKIITGSGRHSARGAPLLLPRIQTLLTEELKLRYAYDTRLVCDARDCKTHLNPGCLVVQLQELFRYLSETRPYETYVVTLPEGRS